MTRHWPDSLPGPSAPYDLAPADAVIRTDMEAGPARVRRISRARRDLVNATFVLTKSEMELFRAWFDDAAWSLAGDSDDLSAWTVSGATITANADLGPQDVLADRIVEQSGGSQHMASRNLAGVPDDATVALAVTLKSAGRTHARVALQCKDGSSASVFADLTAGTLTATGAVTASAIAPRGGDWWRVTMQAPVLTGVSLPQLRVWTAQAGNTVVYSGDGSSAIAVCEAMARIRTGFDLFGRTGADGRVTGADGGAAWVLMPLSFGGYLRSVEARFTAPFKATALPGLGWRVDVSLEVRDA